MNTTQNPPPIGRCPIPDDILRSFCHIGKHPTQPSLSNLLAVWLHRGDGTQTWENQMSRIVGKTAMQHIHYDTIATNGRILVAIPRFRHSDAVDKPTGVTIPAEWFWCFNQIEDEEHVQIADDELIETVPEIYRSALAVLPGLTWMRITTVNYFVHAGNRSIAQQKPPPYGIVFFKFNGGYGLAAGRNDE